MRKKLDGFNVFSNGEAEDVKEADIEKRDLQSLKYKLKYDLRKSLAWDSSFSTSSGILEPEELFSTSNSFKTENAYDMLRPEQDQHLHFNNLKPEIKTVTDGFSLRKSLAWDSAFFTSEGILNHEELSLLNKGHKKSEMGMLPLIEELRISSESNRTIDNDGSSSASQEISVHQSSNTVDSCCRNIQHVFLTESVGSNTFSEVKGSNYVSFDASRTEKPSGLRMPSPNIGYFDMENLLVPSKERDNKPHSRAVSKIQSGQMLKDARNTRTCSSKTRDANNSLTMKFGRGAVSKDGDVKDYLTKDVKMVNSRAHEHAFERKRCAKVDKRRVGNKILREREEQSCLKSKVFAERTPQANTLYPGNDAFKLHESEKENLVGFENIII
ncbi:hypothetical protein LR48_Vigan10g199300 [Vigna angularis]|uniref:Uncharacterized protein n=1 Tax=Phaseolus angularis TaxID=3914 RepID=A0A0L9VM16_PHAAN|nr:hypothetical protein LR48_Vigan10g199300 [Vigna angularis]